MIDPHKKCLKCPRHTARISAALPEPSIRRTAKVQYWSGRCVLYHLCPCCKCRHSLLKCTLRNLSTTRVLHVTFWGSCTLWLGAAQPCFDAGTELSAGLIYSAEDSCILIIAMTKCQNFLCHFRKPFIIKSATDCTPLAVHSS